MNYAALKQRQRAERDHYHDNLGLRVHRALSWLNKAEQESDDDGAFVFLWIAFNAAYATDLSQCLHSSHGVGGLIDSAAAEAGASKVTESGRFHSFIDKLAGLDHDNRLYELVWNDFADNIRLLLDNHYMFQPFWDVQSGRHPGRDWLSEFQAANHAARCALGHKDTTGVISIILSRIYTLRNQIIHGGATYSSGVNRDQVRCGKRFLEGFVPIIVAIMMDHPETLWGDASYPVV